MNLLWRATPILIGLTVSYFLSRIWINICHARRAKQWGCKPAFVRPYRLPFGIDILKRYMDTSEANDAQNDDIRLYQELGEKSTWFQRIPGMWHHVTTDPKNIQAMLATQFNDFELGPVRRGSLEPLFGVGIFTTDGKQWQHSRAMLRPQFTRNQISDLELEETHVQHFFERLPSKGRWTDAVDLLPLFFNLTLDSATEFLFGESVNSQAFDTSVKVSEKSNGPDWSSFGHHFDTANAQALVRFRLMEFYWLYNPKSFREECRIVHECVDYFVKRALSGEKPKSKEDSYVFSYELAKETRDPLQIRAGLFQILLAGRDTTAGTLGFIFYFLARHPAVFNKLRDTILQDFGVGRDNITFETLKSCTYLQHVIAEVNRLEPVVPENGRRASRNTTLPVGGGSDGLSPIYIRKGEEVVYNPRLMHRRKEIWGEDANEFNPDRWQGLRCGWEYLPFSGGPRVCIGQQFALTEVGYVTVRMLQKYDKIENMDDKPLKHRFTQTAAPYEVLVRLHEAEC